MLMYLIVSLVSLKFLFRTRNKNWHHL